MVLRGSGGCCGLHRLVDGVHGSCPHFKSPQTAHGDRNGLSFSPVFPMVAWGLEATPFRSPWAYVGELKYG